MATLTQVVPEVAPEIVEAAPLSLVDRTRAEQVSFAVLTPTGGEPYAIALPQLVEHLRQQLLSGGLAPGAAMELRTKNEDGTWAQSATTLDVFARQHFPLRVLYHPVWAHAMEGLKWGALIGIGLKLLDTIVMLFSVNPGMGLLFLATIGVCCIPRLGALGMAVIAFMMFKSGVPNFFMMLLGAVAAGAALGCLTGMGIGGIVGLMRRAQVPVVDSNEPDSKHVAVTAVVLPLAGAAAIISFYFFVVMPWLVSVLS